MKYPVLDDRDLDRIRQQVAGLARSYTPEWRYERTEDDPGAALAELFSTMFHQTVDRMNALPGKLYMEFLNQIGYREPAPVPASGVMVFTPNDMDEEPVPVPQGTQVFTPDPQGENIVYETLRPIQATAARLEEIYYTDPQADRIRRLDLSRPARFFSGEEGEELQRHRFSLGRSSVLRLDGPSEITLELRQPVRHLEEETARQLAGENLTWTYRHAGRELPFDAVRAEHGRIVLEKRSHLALEPEEEGGEIAIFCQGSPEVELQLEEALLTSAPLEPCPAQNLFSGDLPIEPEGGYCFGRRPAPYALFYLRCDSALSKAGARASLHLVIAPIVDEPDTLPPQFSYGPSIIDKRDAVEIKPDDVWISGVVWEYYNGLGWRQLAVTGDKNPFSCKRDGRLEVVFQVPEDLEPTEVNAQPGWYIRARVTELEHPFSYYQRWILPFVQTAEFSWQYTQGVRARTVRAENNGLRTALDGADGMGPLGVTLLRPMDPGLTAMYLRFDRSPHAMPLSLRFELAGRARLEGALQWEWWDGTRFQPVRCVDGTDGFYHSGEWLLYLPQPLPRSELLGMEGCWLRVSCSARVSGPAPVVSAVVPNAITAVQRQREPDQFFDTQAYEAGKVVALLARPVQDCQVWVDEMSGLSAAQAQAMAQGDPDNVRLELDGHDPVRCWVRWQPVADLDMTGPEERCYELDPYEGTIRFGDGRLGKVPPAGDHNIHVSYASGGGARGNVPAGAVNALLGGLPRISSVANRTAMSGGTGRPDWEEIEERGNRRLRTRGRAAGRRDYEDLVWEYFPQVRHVRCFAGRDARGNGAPGHVTVVLAGYGQAGIGMEQLCREVYRFLSRRCSCCLAAEGRLHVCPATVLQVNTQVTVELAQPDQAADTQREIVRRLEALIQDTWRARPIGGQIRVDEIWAAVRDVPNVRLIRQILVEGAYDQEGNARLAPLEGESDFPYGVAESGTHLVRMI